MDNLHWD